MRKHFISFLSCLCIFSAAFSQQGAIKGTITDTLNKQNLSQAVISVLRAKDSVLVKYTRSNTQGNFEITKLPAGNLILMVTYPTYADYVEKIVLEAGQEKSLGSLPLLTKAHLLEEVIVKQRVSAVRIKGDTTEYAADSFRVGPNADVQELLRKMPGIQVNSKGEITAQGARVQKVLVDGEEFFSDDPAVVTKNLRADIVDKVQAFDKKSDQADFTGIDDGQKIKTLNIQLKEDKKKGYFGKLEIGKDPFDRYRYGKALVNAFKGKRKISSYLTTDNTKYESLNWDESRNYGGDANVTTEINDDGGISMWSSGDEFSWGRGFPTSVTGGLHYSNKWNKDKHSSNNTYQYNNLNVSGETYTYNENLLPGNNFKTRTTQSQYSDRNRHKLTSVYEWKIDSSSSLKITARGAYIKGHVKTTYTGETRNELNQLINNSQRSTHSNDDNSTMSSNILWRKKFKKTGRSISIGTDLSLGDRNENTLLQSSNNLYDKGIYKNNLLVDQMKVKKSISSTINSVATYTEPLWKNTFLVMNYRVNISQSNAKITSFDKDVSGKYEDVVDTLSNHFVFNTTGHAGGASFRYNGKKINFNIGAGAGPTRYRMQNIQKGTDRDISFTNFLPSASFNYTPKKQRRLSIGYNGNTRNPTLAQIQPLVDNTDPLNITVGNAGLRQSFEHSFSLSASDYKVLKSKNLYTSIRMSMTDNAISNASTVDSFNRRVNQAINVNGNYSMSAYIDYGFEVMPSLNLGFGVSPRKSRYINYVNGLRNETVSSNTDFNIQSGFWKDNWINYWMQARATYNHSVSSIRPNHATAYWSYTIDTEVRFKFKKLKLYADLGLSANFYQKTATFPNPQNFMMLSPSVRKVLGKTDAWEIKLRVNDLLNQSQGIRRSISSNFYSETVDQTIQRYFMLSLIYNFSKNGKPTNNGW